MTTMLCQDIHWVGYVDWAVRDFHGYETQRGSTYNAYLVRDAKTALVDTVKAPYAEHLLEQLAALGAPPLDYVVCNHAEPDHSGGLPRVMQAFPRAELVCNAKCRAALDQHYDTSAWKFRVIGSGESLSLGRRTLRFLDTPMVHWPESMFTYVPEEQLLFSMDAFGQHYASAERFADEVPADVVLDEAKTYYANIIMPYGKAVVPCLEKIAAWKIEVIAPSHGVIWRRDPAAIVGAYRDWTAGRPKAKVLVLYDTMWESTTQMAEAIREGAAQPGVEVHLFHLRRTGLTRIAAEVLDAAAVAFGSATLNRGMMPAAAAALSYLQGLRPAAKTALAFGSYGWAAGGTEAVLEGLRALSWEVLGEPVTAKYRPTPEVLQQCCEAGRQLAQGALAAARKAD